MLLVEDDAALGEQVRAGLAEEGLVVRWVRMGRDAIAARTERYALVILDLGLPDIDGWDVLRHLRSQADVPVLVLTARSDPTSRVRGLDLGADDYLTKPFWPDELLARVRARLRRPQLLRSNTLRVGDIAIDLERHEVHVGESLVALTPGEHALLVALARRPGAVVSRRRLAELALDADADERHLDAHVSRLRRKLGSAQHAIETVRRVGYRVRESW